MNGILLFVKNYFTFMLILFLFSYLAPKKDYKKYFQFFIGVLMITFLVSPILKLFRLDYREDLLKQMEEIEEEISRMEYRGKGEDIYERFIKDYEENTAVPGETNED